MKTTLLKIINYLLGGFFSQLLFLFLWFFVSKRVSLVEIGKYQLWLFLIDLLVIISMLGLDIGYAKLFHNNKIKDFDSMSLKLINLVALIFLFLAGLLYIFEIIRMPELSGYVIFIVVLTIIVQLNFVFLLNKLIVMGKAKEYGLFQVSRSLLILLSTIIVIDYFDKSSFALFFGQFIGVSISLIFLIQLIGVEFKNVNIFIADSKQILQYTIPLMLSGIVGVLTVYSSRLILNATLTLEQVGALGIYMGFSSPIIAIIAAINKFYYPFAIKELSKENSKNKLQSYFLHITLGYIFLFYLGVFIYYLFFRDILFSRKLVDNSFIFLHIAASSIPIVLYTLYSPMFFFDNSKKVLTVNILAFSIGSVLQYFLLLSYGFRVVGIGILITQVLILVFSFFLFRNEYNLDRSDFILFLIVLAAITPILLLN
jgi:O-antigen/teichoic acid export membrane protein